MELAVPPTPALKHKLDAAVVEKDVESAYRAELSAHRQDAVWTSPHGTDGLATWTRDLVTVRLLLEAKFSTKLRERGAVSGVLAQLVSYLKKFEQAGSELPNVLLAGDRGSCFILETTAVRRFLDHPVDWTRAPSDPDQALVQALVDGVDILPHVYDVDPSLDFEEVLAAVEVLAAGRKNEVRATESNLAAIFLYWRDRVFRDGTGKQALTPVDQVDVFLRALFHPDEVYAHPTRKGVVVVPGYDQGVLVNADAWGSFFARFQRGYTPSEVEHLYGLKDQLVEDDARRRQGAFFTPRLWVDEAHREVSRVLGDSWRKDCVVWDPAAGTGNLTRDYRDWGLLVSSTAERADVQVMRDQGWGGQAVFQYDFLNPDAESPFFEPEDGDNRVPVRVERMLREAAKEGKRLVFLMNPPYGTANDAGAKGTSKAGIADTLVNRGMKTAKMGACSQQLYAQFMYRCAEVAREYGFKEYTLATFSVPTFMSSGSYRPFRDWWYGQHTYKGGFLFQASHFADVSGRWGVSFTVWSSGVGTSTIEVHPVRLCDLENFAVLTNSVKHVYSSDGREASEWVRTHIKGLKGVDAPLMSSGLKVKDGGICYGDLATGGFSYVQNKGNNLMESGTGVSWMSSTYANAHGFSVLPFNWRRAVALYSARKLVAEDWMNQKDEYLVPDESLSGYGQWVDDCHVYVLLHASNNCTAMRDVQYKGKSWRIKNHWFWRTRSTTLSSLDTHKTAATYRDCRSEPVKAQVTNEITGENQTQPWELDGDPYFGHLLASGAVKLSPDAQHVLDLLDALWVKSLPERESYYGSRPVTDKEPDLHLTAWDAGVYQLKHLWREHHPKKWEELRTAHKALADRLREGVYDYGFLRR